MSVEIAAKLRLLAQDYQDGRLDLAAYRALRAPLLDSLVENVYSIKAAMEVTQPRTSARRVDAEVTQPGKPLALPREPVRASGGSGNASPSKRSRSLWIGAGVILVAVTIAAVLLLRYGGRRDGDVSVGAPGAGAVSNADANADATAAAAEAVRRHIDAFVDRADWSEGRLASLNASLLEMGAARMAAASREAWFQRFVDELRRRLKEQQALAIAPLTVNDSPLAALAVTVGLDLNSPDAAIHIVAVPVEAAAEQGRDANQGTMLGVNPGAHPGPRANAGANAGANPGAKSGAGALASAGSDAHAELLLATAPGAQPLAATASDTPDPCHLELIRSRRPLCQDTSLSGIDAPLMALVPAGTFDMGSNAAPNEQPVHHVTIRAPFAISVYEVSQGEFRQFCEQTHRTCEKQPWDGDDYPVVNVSWDDARAYADWLSSVTHRHYSLPTEAQWEYAARAGQTGHFPGGDTLSPTDAHYSLLAKQTTAVRRSQKFNANAFRLVHVLGNVREWVDDASASSSMRVARGGSYADSAAHLRLSKREELIANTRDTRTGFRIVRELPPG